MDFYVRSVSDPKCSILQNPGHVLCGFPQLFLGRKEQCETAERTSGWEFPVLLLSRNQDGVRWSRLEGSGWLLSRVGALRAGCSAWCQG